MEVIGPKDAAKLLEAGGVQLIDVREPGEWSSGHLPGAKNVPLETLKANPKQHLSAGKTLFVCARGMRSQRAAEAAEAAGFKDVISMDGGTQAWESLGLPLERVEVPRAKASAPVADNSAAPDDPSCGLPDPGLDLVVAENLKTLRQSRGLSLDQLAAQTGLSRTVLGQLELGKTSPSVGMVWRIAQAFDVHFSALLATHEVAETRLLRKEGARRLVSPDGRFSSRALYPLGSERDVEFYELFLAAHSREDAKAHAPGTRENLVITSGRLELLVNGKSYELTTGDAIVFTADVEHSYVNPGGQDCWMYLVMTYANRQR